jgi:hypothetical protein
MFLNIPELVYGDVFMYIFVLLKAPYIIIIIIIIIIIYVNFLKIQNGV